MRLIFAIMKKSLVSIAFVATFALTGAVSYKAWKYRSIAIEAQSNSEASTSRTLRDIIFRDAGYPEPRDSMEASRAVRDWIYRTNKVERGEAYSSNGALIYANLGKPGSGQLCGGMSTAYAWALNTIGIPARTVQLAADDYLQGEEEGATHVTVEAYIDGEWRVSDPTFNAEFQCGDQEDLLDIKEMRECVAKGGTLTSVAGKTQLKGRTVEEYYLPYAAFLAAYVRAPVSTALISEPIEVDPPNWLEDSVAHY